MMIKVTAGTTTRSFEKVIDNSTIIQDFLAENNISTAGATVNLDAQPLTDLSKSFADMGVTSDCYLFSVVNSKNA